ncbi:MAG: hypothetical protein RLZZ234_755 [Candidatus Parcubacteria bacterium]|jgi:uncharacterized LabA/DUF88 family protein
MAIIKHIDQRVAVFIDTQNLYHSAKNIHKSKVNFGEVLNQAVGPRKLVRAVAYVVTTESGEEQAFFDALAKVGIETKTKELQIFFGGAKKADWDVGLAIDAIKMASKLDAVILATGDGDFVPLVEYIKAQGCQVEIIAFGRSASARLKEAADEFVDMDNDPGTFLIGRRQGSDTRGGGNNILVSGADQE